jgi:EpsI family protein
MTTVINSAPEGPAVKSSDSAGRLQDPATVAALKKRTLLLLLILAPAIVLTIWLVIAERRVIRLGGVADKVIPATITTEGKVWTSSRMMFSELEMQILETRDYVFRTYSDGTMSNAPGKGPVDLCVVFSDDNRKGTHPPDVCLEAGGSRIISRSDRTLTINGEPLVLRELVTAAVGAQGDQYTYFSYFYKCGDTFTPSFYHQQVQIIWNGLTRQNTAGALIRYSTPMSKFTDIEAARARADELLMVTFPYLKKLNATEAKSE